MTISLPVYHDAPIIYALNFSFWKRRILRYFFPNSRLIFTNNLDKIPEATVLVVWGMSSIPDHIRQRIHLLRLEDGFLRSVGLGTDLIRPISWIIDSRSLYFDARVPSDLEILLMNTVFSKSILDRANTLRLRVISERLTKYNISANHWPRPPHVDRVILVPGQIESDASILYGSPEIRSNLALLDRVRSENPDAYILYKPHPDIVAGMRAESLAEKQFDGYCDECITDISMGQLLDQVDEVHVLTSLTGFEALLRGKRVVCYGQPFYAGWGLTIDKNPIERRTRRLTVNELVAASLIIYPRYIHPKTGALITPESALDTLLSWRKNARQKTPWWRKLFRVVLRQVVGVR